MGRDVSGAGSGISRRTRLNMPQLIGPDTQPITFGDLRKFQRAIQAWADKLPFGRIGFQVATYDPTLIGGVITDSPITFLELVEDSHRFAKTDLVPDLTYFQIPPGLGRAYALSYNVEVQVREAHVVTFTFTGAVQDWEVPATVTEVTAVVKGAEGGGPVPATDAGQGAMVTGTFSVTPADHYDVFVGGDQWPNGGFGDNNGGNSGYNGGGSSDIRPTGLTLADTRIVAAGGGGSGGGGAVVSAKAWNGGYVEGQGANTNPGGGYGGGKGTQTVGGAGGWTVGFGGPVLPKVGQDGAFDLGGNAGNTTNALAYAGGGGGGGWFGGGGAGLATGASVPAGPGGGGSSHVGLGVFGVSHSDGTVFGDGSVELTYYTYTPVADTDVSVKLWVAYRNWLDEPPYGHTVVISADSGLSPLKGCIFHPLSENDRIWMTITNAEVDASYTNLVLSVYADGL